MSGTTTRETSSTGIRLIDIVQEATGSNVFLCYQCVKCTSGCPLAEYFDLTPNQVMRAVQLGMDEQALSSKAIWLCAACQTCTTRCPQGLDIAGTMDVLRMESRKRGYEPAVPEVAAFNDVFLRNIKLLGRSYEAGLMAELNLRKHKPMDDMDLGVEMIFKRKIALLPHFVRPPKNPKREERAENEVAYFPGCSLHSTAPELNRSTLGVAEALGITLTEPKGWLCCGSSPAHAADPLLADSLPITNLSLIERSGFDEMVAPCVACYGRFKTAVHHTSHDPQWKAEVEEAVGQSYEEESVKVWSLVDLILEKVGIEAIQEQMVKPLEGLKVVNYYGCLMTRPPEIMQAPNPENPRTLDRLMEALGAESLDWSYKTDCCGASLSLSDAGIVLELSEKILRAAQARGADAVVVACSLCHANLDARQKQMSLEQPIPIIYFTQLMALALGLDEKAMALNKNLIDPRPLLAEKGLLN
ncbi:MAG: heterodisulfide reductase-related iron-sulfur binding cluster [Chloroflexota bacterium]|nr:heterodisulfide reductase-related iron-sulfur binding cluster [Chloroflexota bacterium]